MERIQASKRTREKLQGLMGGQGQAADALGRGYCAPSAGSDSDAANWIPRTPAECHRSRRPLVIWGMSA